MAMNMKSYKREIELNDNVLEQSFFGFDTKETEQNLNAISASARKGISKINSYAVTGKRPDVVQFLNEVMLDSRRAKVTGNKAHNYQSFIDQVETGEVNLIFNNEQNRFQRYRSIDAVCTMIPQLSRILKLYRDMIISPNDFKNTDFNFIIKNLDAEDEEGIELKQDALKRLDEQYRISEELSVKIVGDLVKYGDAFAIVLDFEKEITDLLKQQTAFESANMNMRDNSDMTLAKEDAEFLNETVKKMINEEYSKFKSLKGEKAGRIPVANDLTPDQWVQQIDDFMKMEYSENLLNILGNDEVEIIRDIHDDNNLHYIDGEGYSIASEAAGRTNKYNLTGSIVRHLEPSKVIKVEVGGTVIGYYYLDVIFADSTADSLSYDPDSCPACDLTYTNNRMYSFVSHMNTKGAASTNSRAQMLADIFTRRMAQKLNKRFIAKNSQFREFIYTILKTNQKIQKTTMMFIPASKIIHFKNGTRTYGEGVIDSVLYFAKLYVLSLLSALMQQIILGKDKQIYYIDTGLDEDSEGAVQAFIADLKSREITIDDFSDVTSIFNRVTKSNAMFIPTVDGKKAVEFDTFSGQEAQFNNDFLTEMLKNIISGTGFPTGWLDSGMADIEFATQLVQQNGNVLKNIMSYQKISNRGFTEMFRKLYTNEKLNLGTIEFEAQYPPPTTLDSKQIEEAMQRAQGIADFIIQTVMGDTPSQEDEAAKPMFKREIVKKYMSNIDWKEMEDLLRKAREDQKEFDLVQQRKQDSQEEDSQPESDDQGGSLF